MLRACAYHTYLCHITGRLAHVALVDDKHHLFPPLPNVLQELDLLRVTRTGHTSSEGHAKWNGPVADTQQVCQK